MSEPIKATPILFGQDSIDWWQQVQDEQNKLVGLVPTPELEELRKEILAGAKKRRG